MKLEHEQLSDIARVYFWIALVIIAAVALVNPPFLVADETNHFFRAVQISHGGFIGVKLPDGWAGGWLPLPVLKLGFAFGTMPFNPASRTSIGALAALFHLTWPGPLNKADFANTVIYPPQFYLPGAFALFVARHLHIHLLQSFYIARLFSGLVCVSASALALRLCAAPARPWLLFCLCLPEVLGLYASLSQDGPFIACAMLACALLTRCAGPLAEGSKLTMGLAIALLALFVSAKPPYLPVLFLPLALVERQYLRFTFIGVLIGLAAVLLWSFLGMHPVMVHARAGDISPARQIHNMLAHPGIVPVVIYNTFIGTGLWLAETSIATVSWVDAGMPHWFYIVVGVLAALLAGSFAVQFLKPENRRYMWRLLFLLLLILGAGAGATLSTYLTWDEVGRNSAWGVLGRYFTPLLVCLTPGAVFVGQGCGAQHAKPVLVRALLYLFLPFCGTCYLSILFLRFWWPA